MPATTIRTRTLGLLALAVTSVLVGTHVGRCCETPVYRYAMYRWNPTPYEVYFFHDKPASDHDKEVERAISELSEGSENRANFVFLPVNLEEDKELNRVPLDIKKAWNEREDKQLPAYLISTPYGKQIYSGKLDAATVQSLADSPARHKMAQQLEAGKVAVLVMLTGTDDKENKQVESLLTGLLKDVTDGKVKLDQSLPDAAEDDEVKDGDSTPAMELAMVKVDRNSQEERWFVRALLAMEDDLVDEDRPMVFVTYGRARALLPYIGAGISRDNLIREVETLGGPCSCTVKEENPGVDLLVRYDWEAAAAALAERFGSEEGNESQFGPDTFFPELIIPSSSSQANEQVATSAEDKADTTETKTSDESQPDETAGDDTTEVADVAAGVAAEEAIAETGATHGDVPDGDQVAHAPSRSSLPSQPVAERDFSTFSSLFVVGGGVAVALIVLFGITFLVMRPQ